tara:strand:+ start:125 stop:286 length:162 start_codon:yes stop_codon:yes gene_type:complete
MKNQRKKMIIQTIAESNPTLTVMKKGRKEKTLMILIQWRTIVGLSSRTFYSNI